MNKKHLIFILNLLSFLLIEIDCRAIGALDQPEVLNFNPGWKLSKGTFSPLITDDKDWEVVSTPHTYHEKFAYHRRRCCFYYFRNRMIMGNREVK